MVDVLTFITVVDFLLFILDFSPSTELLAAHHILEAEASHFQLQQELMISFNL
jgi:hypothetical protein